MIVHSDLPVFHYEHIREMIFEKVVMYEPLKCFFMEGLECVMNNEPLLEEIVNDIYEDLRGYYHINCDINHFGHCLLLSFEYMCNKIDSLDFEPI